MRVLIAEDDSDSFELLATLLNSFGYEISGVDNGEDALKILQGPNRPMLAILDWMMPGLSGVDVCRKLREQPSENPTYIILLTSLTSESEIVEGLEAGADDYITKPFDFFELNARIGVGQRVLDLQASLNTRVKELEDALGHVRTLQGILPICMHCHKIRDDKQSWQQIEAYLAQHTDVQFSHGVCEKCLQEHHGDI